MIIENPSQKDALLTAVEFFLHGMDRPVVIQAVLGDVLGDVLAKHNALPREGEVVLVGEVRDIKIDHDLQHEELVVADLKLTLLDLEVRSKRHIHTRSSRAIKVTVEFNGQAPHHAFRPHTTVEAVLAWAKHRLSIDPVAGAALVLETVPGGDVPRMDAFLSDLAHGCAELTFKLVKEVTPQGAI